MSRLLIRVLALSSIAALCILCCLSSVRLARATPPSGYSLVWSDEFNGAALDTINTWNYRLFEKEKATSIRDAVSLDGSNLVITTYTESGKHYVGVIDTKDHFMPRYGYIEASIDFNSSFGMFSTFWLWSPNYSVRGPNGWDPHGNGTEIDIVEHALQNSCCDTHDNAPPTLHWDGYQPDTERTISAGPQTGSPPDLSSGFHTYGLKWTPDVQMFYYDDVLVWTVNNSTLQDPPGVDGWPWVQTPPPPAPSVGPVSQTSEFIELSSEVPNSGRGSIGTDPCNSPGFGSLFPPCASVTKMKVGYVRHYALLPSPTSVGWSACTMNKIQINWTTPSNGVCPATRYEVRYSLNPIIVEDPQTSESNWNSATLVSGGAPGDPGTAHTLWVTGLNSCTGYYFAVRERDTCTTVNGGNVWSGFGNPFWARTQCVANGPCLYDNGFGAKGTVPGDEDARVRQSLLELRQASPIPASSVLEIEYVSPALPGARVDLAVFDVGGRRIAGIVSGDAQPGNHRVQWNLRDDSGDRVRSGMYWLRLRVGNETKQKTVVVQ